MNEFADAFRRQAEACDRLGSPLYGHLLGVAANDIDSGGPTAVVLRGWEGNPRRAALALRFMGAIHRLVLQGNAPGLAAHYPTAGGTPQLDRIDAPFIAIAANHRDEIREGCETEVQTNEVGRCGVLLAGLLSLEWTDRPFRLLEIGSSAGLQLMLDRYRYELGLGTWGEAEAEPLITTQWSRAFADLDRTLDIASRAGCDVSPIDATDPEARLRIESFVWPDQQARFERLRAALEGAAESPPPLAQAAAHLWLPEMLRDEQLPTVVMHSVMWQYLSDADQTTITTALSDAGSRATEDRPLALVSFENDNDGFRLSVTEWPSGETSVIGVAQAHGAWLRDSLSEPPAV